MRQEQETYRPKNLHIIIRKMDFDFDTSLRNDRYWNDNNVVSTHFINALQDTFPEGERFFMDAARDGAEILHQKGLMDKKLEQDLHAFSMQEASHSWLHNKWTQALIKIGYARLADYGDQLHKVHLWLNRHLSVKMRLSITSAAEHYTASIAYILIHIKPGLVTQSTSPFKDMLLYHAMEELEHKSVCFDLYQKLSGNYLLRLFGLLFATFDLSILIFTHYKYLMKKDGLWDVKHRKLTRQFLFGNNGLIKSIWPKIKSYMKLSFHPWQTDDRREMEYAFGDYIRKLEIRPFEY
jgi:predicted metal-dependent hydrolase